jgi:ribonuclease BN (tRNA processing enzyme)
VRWLRFRPVTTDRHAWRDELGRRRAPRRVDHVDRLVLLGTAGGANPKATRCGYANAVVVGGAAYLVDCGEGVHSQLHRAGLAATRRFATDRPLVAAICITHLHADHVMDLANIFQGSWPSSPIDVYGPGPAGPPFTTFDDPVHPLRYGDDPAPGLRRMIDHLNRAFAMNISSRAIAEHRGDFVDHVRIHEIGLAGETAAGGAGEGDVLVPIELDRSDPQFTVPAMEPFVVRPEDEHGVTVTATLVQHAPVFPALAYRFDTPSGSVVFSGDTGPCDNVVRLAQGADVLVHEVIDLDALLGRLSTLPNYEAVRRQLATSHTPYDRVGDIATRAGVRTLVLSHLVPGEGSHTPEEWEALVRPHFAGDVVCGVDLDELPLR